MQYIPTFIKERDAHIFCKISCCTNGLHAFFLSHFCVWNVQLPKITCSSLNELHHYHYGFCLKRNTHTSTLVHLMNEAEGLLSLARNI